MTDLPTTASVTIIGGGAVGVSLLYHLAKVGFTDCLLLEKNDLTAGSTWHAAGNCPTFSTSPLIMAMQTYSTALYRGLAEAVDYPINYHVTGSLRLAHSKERMQEFAYVAGLSRRMGGEMTLLSPDEMGAYHPFLEIHDLAGGLWDPVDGDIDPAQLTQAMARGARTLGQTIARNTPVTGIDRKNGEWIVKTPNGDIRTEIVVNAAGYYAGRVAEWFRPFVRNGLWRATPLAVLSHQYLLTEEIPEIRDFTRGAGKKLPIVRDVDVSYYLRQEKNGLNLGPYERNSRAHWVTPDDPMPDDFSFQLYPDDLDRLETYIADAMARVPPLAKAGVSSVINGPIPYAPDGLPMLGPMPGLANVFEAHSFTFGIAQSGGAGKMLADWIVEGAPEHDMWPVDPRRFTAHADQDFSLKKALETYGHEYAMHFPNHAWPAARDRKLSPAHTALSRLGAQFKADNGWERALWFAKAGDDVSEAASQTWRRDGPWEPRVRAECEAVATRAGLFDLTGVSRFRLSGAGAAEWLNGTIAGPLPAIGHVAFSCFADQRGRFLTGSSILRNGEDSFTLVGAAASEWHDYDLLTSTLPDGLALENVTATEATFLLAGPAAEDILNTLSNGAVDLSGSGFMKAPVAGRPSRITRALATGGDGFEIVIRNEDAPEVHAALLAKGAAPAGMIALDRLRLEAGLGSWKRDFTADFSLMELGLEAFVDLTKPDFTGRSALQREQTERPSRRLTTLVLDPCEHDPLPGSSIFNGDAIVGTITSSGFGYRTSALLALAMIEGTCLAAGTRLDVDIFGSRNGAMVLQGNALAGLAQERIHA